MEKLGYVLVPAGIAAVLYGVHQVTAGVVAAGWGAVAGGIACLVIAYRLMSSARPRDRTTSRRE